MRGLTRATDEVPFFSAREWTHLNLLLAKDTFELSRVHAGSGNSLFPYTRVKSTSTLRCMPANKQEQQSCFCSRFSEAHNWKAIRLSGVL
jgi:hypothetical protein